MKHCPNCGADLSKQLTKRERQCVELVAQGKPNKVIAYEMGITEGTVKVQISRILDKVGVPNRTALAIWFLNQRSQDAAANEVCRH